MREAAHEGQRPKGRESPAEGRRGSSPPHLVDSALALDRIGWDCYAFRPGRALSNRSISSLAHCIVGSAENTLIFCPGTTDEQGQRSAGLDVDFEWPQCNRHSGAHRSHRIGTGTRT